jgi:hypothetical protein
MAAQAASLEAIKNANEKIASAETPEEAKEWQGIVNQQLAALEKLEELKAAELENNKLNLVEEDK